MISYKVAYRKTKRGSVIKVRDYSRDEPAKENENQKLDPQTAPTPSEDTKFQYPKHLTPDEVKIGLEEGRLLKGKFQASRENNLEGFVAVNIENEDVHVLLQGKESLNRAIHDDEVVIELLPKSEWRAKSDLVLLPEETVENEDNNSEQDDVVSAAKKLQLIDKTAHIKPTAKVVAIFKRLWRQYTGVLRRNQSSFGRTLTMTRCLFVPSDRKIPVIRIETRQYDTLKNQRLLVAIDSWPRASRYPLGHYIKSLGTIGDKETENQVLLLEHDVPHSSFTDAVLNCLPVEGNKWKISQDEINKRVDLRCINVCSVDPPGCTDIDDALHYRELDNEFCEVGVHIADVSHFVKPNTPLDSEAADRGTTVYLSDRRIDMIPELLSSNLCSLIQHQDRLAFSAVWKMRKSTAEILEVKFMKSIINSKASLTYEKAQSMIDDKSNNSEIYQSLRGLNNLAKKLKKKRIDKGALVLARADEIRFVETESETHERDSTLEIQHKKMVETNSMVEEFMLLANISVANQLLSVFPEQALLRRHPKPSKANFDDLIESAKVKGFEIIPENGKSLSDSLDRAQMPNDYFFNLMLRMIATRCMTPAAYFCSGYVDSQLTSFNHFGLAAELYTHFTSPIRRYADLLVHRLLAASINCGEIDKNLRSSSNIQILCDQINYRHRMAQLASRASARLHTVLYIKSKRELIEEAYIFFVRQNAIQILLPRIAFEYTYFLQPSTAWKYNVSERSQTNTENGFVLKQFDKLKVHVSITTKDDTRFSDKIQVKIIEPKLDEPTVEGIVDENNSLIESNMQISRDIEMSTSMDYNDNDKIEEGQLGEEFLIEEISAIEMKKKIRLDLTKTTDDLLSSDESLKPVIVMPGDVLEKYITKDTTMLGPGLMRDDNKVVAIKSGILKMRNNNIFWVDSHQKRYVASRGECVIGIIRSKGSLHVRVDINSADLATLSLLAFEGANKRNKPNLNVGDLVYAKVLAASKHCETELICVNSNGKRDGLGQLSGGIMITLSIDTIRVLLSPQCDLLEKLGSIYRYEIALGLNGRIWINSSENSTLIKVTNELRKFDIN